jgi:hypothetical protein
MKYTANLGKKRQTLPENGKKRQSFYPVCRSKSAKLEQKRRKRQNGKVFKVKRDRGVRDRKKGEEK